MGGPSEKDIVASVVSEYAQPWDKAIERRVVRKIDLALIPLMWIGYDLNIVMGVTHVYWNG